MAEYDTFVEEGQGFFSGLDKTEDSFLIAWWLNCTMPVGKAPVIYQTFHADSQGCPQIDRWLGTQMTKPKWLNNEKYGSTIKAYLEWTRAMGEGAKGRVIAAIIGVVVEANTGLII